MWHSPLEHLPAADSSGVRKSRPASTRSGFRPTSSGRWYLSGVITVTSRKPASRSCRAKNSGVAFSSMTRHGASHANPPKRRMSHRQNEVSRARRDYVDQLGNNHRGGPESLQCEVGFGKIRRMAAGRIGASLLHKFVAPRDLGGDNGQNVRLPNGVYVRFVVYSALNRLSDPLEVSPTGSMPRRENPAWQVANDKVEASRAKLHLGQEAPKGIRPLTRVTRPQSRDK